MYSVGLDNAGNYLLMGGSGDEYSYSETGRFRILKALFDHNRLDYIKLQGQASGKAGLVTPGAVTWSSSLPPGKNSTRTFTAAKRGTMPGSGCHTTQRQATL